MRRLKLTSVFLVGFVGGVCFLVAPAQAMKFWMLTTSAIAANLDDALDSAKIFVGSAGNVATPRAMSGAGAISNTGVLSLTATSVTGAALTNFVAGAGTVADTDTILEAINKIVANIALKANIASPTFTGTVTSAATIDSSLTASKPVFTDGSKQLVSTGTLGADQGGTGVANGAGETITMVGDDTITFTTSANTSVTLPASGTLATTANVSDASGMVEELNIFVETAADKTYVLVLNAAYARQITSIQGKCASGTISGELKIEGTGITSCQAAQLPWTSTETTDTCDTGASNDLAAGNTLTLVTTSNSSCLDLQVTVKTTRD